jgi:hypothetical protein
MVIQSAIPLYEFRSTRGADKKSVSTVPHDESRYFALDEVRSRSTALSLLTKALLACAALVLAAATAIATAGVPARKLLARTAWCGNPRSFGSAAQAEPQPTDAVERQGPFVINDQQYTVVLHEKVLRANSSPAGSERSSVTLAGLEILDASGHAAYQETFAVVLADGSFSQTLAASASLFAAEGGTAIVLRFIGQPVFASGALGALAKESWQVFGLVKGQLTIFGAVLPLGQGADITVGGVVTGVTAKGGIVVVPLASTAEQLEFRAWTGNFYVFVPVRVDWLHGQWGEGEQCYELARGTLRERGCIMRVEAEREPRPGSSETAFVQLFAATNESESQQVAIRADSKVDFLEVLATVRWSTTDGRVVCSFDNVWLRTRIDGNNGWVHGNESFEALELPQKIPR